MSPFDGDTYDPGHDRARLTGQLLRVYRYMVDAQWRTLPEIRATAGGTDASCSARLRDLRKEKFGAHVVKRRRRGEAKKGLWEYQLLVGEVWTPIRKGATVSGLCPHCIELLRDSYKAASPEDRAAIDRVIRLTERPA